MRLAKTALIALVLGASATLSTAQERLRGISVVGESEIRVAPDLAIVSLGVTAEGPESGPVLDATSSAVGSVLAALTEMGIAESDIQTSGVSLSPRYAPDRDGRMDYSQIAGYSATNTLTVQVHDLLTLGDVLSRTVSAGANSMNGIQFALEDDAEIRDQARREAVADARRRAELYADAANVALGNVITLSETAISSFAPTMAMEPMMEASLRSANVEVPIAAGEITISASIQATFEIND